MIGNAVHVMGIATGEIDDDTTPDGGKNQAAVEFGKRGQHEQPPRAGRAACRDCAEGSGEALE